MCRDMQNQTPSLAQLLRSRAMIYSSVSLSPVNPLHEESTLPADATGLETRPAPV